MSLSSRFAFAKRAHYTTQWICAAKFAFPLRGRINQDIYIMFLCSMGKASLSLSPRALPKNPLRRPSPPFVSKISVPCPSRQCGETGPNEICYNHDRQDKNSHREREIYRGGFVPMVCVVVQGQFAKIFHAYSQAASERAGTRNGMEIGWTIKNRGHRQ